MLVCSLMALGCGTRLTKQVSLSQRDTLSPRRPLILWRVSAAVVLVVPLVVKNLLRIQWRSGYNPIHTLRRLGPTSKAKPVLIALLDFVSLMQSKTFEEQASDGRIREERRRRHQMEVQSPYKRVPINGSLRPLILVRLRNLMVLRDLSLLPLGVLRQLFRRRRLKSVAGVMTGRRTRAAELLLLP